jgi:hypothetical protein
MAAESTRRQNHSIETGATPDVSDERAPYWGLVLIVLFLCCLAFWAAIGYAIWEYWKYLH